MESRSKSESPRTVFVNSVLILRRKCCGSLLERISRTGQFCAEYSDASPAWKNCLAIQTIFAHIYNAWNYQKRFIVNGERRRFLNRSMVVLLDIGGKLTT